MKTQLRQIIREVIQEMTEMDVALDNLGLMSSKKGHWRDPKGNVYVEIDSKGYTTILVDRGTKEFDRIPPRNINKVIRSVKDALQVGRF